MLLIVEMSIGLAKHAKDLQPIDRECPCPTCAGGMTRAFLYHLVAEETVAAHGPHTELQVPTAVQLY